MTNDKLEDLPGGHIYYHAGTREWCAVSICKFLGRFQTKEAAKQAVIDENERVTKYLAAKQKET